MDESVKLLVLLSVDDGDNAELNDLTLQLKSEISDLKVDLVENVSLGNAPEGTKATDWVAIGQIAVTLAPVIVPALFNLLKSWVDRRPATPIKIKIKVKRKSAEVEYDPTKTSPKDLKLIVQTLRESIK
jgi:hypothetical protein